MAVIYYPSGATLTERDSVTGIQTVKVINVSNQSIFYFDTTGSMTTGSLSESASYALTASYAQSASYAPSAASLLAGNGIQIDGTTIHAVQSGSYPQGSIPYSDTVNTLAFDNGLEYNPGDGLMVTAGNFGTLHAVSFSGVSASFTGPLKATASLAKTASVAYTLRNATMSIDAFGNIDGGSVGGSISISGIIANDLVQLGNDGTIHAGHGYFESDAWGNVNARSITSSLQGTASYAITASYSIVAFVTSSTNYQSSASWASASLSSSYANNASTASLANTVITTGVTDGNNYSVALVTPDSIHSVEYDGNVLFTYTPNAEMLYVNNIQTTNIAATSVTASLLGTASYATTASYALNGGSTPLSYFTDESSFLIECDNTSTWVSSPYIRPLCLIQNGGMFEFKMTAISYIIQGNFNGYIGFKIIYTDPSGSVSIGPQIICATPDPGSPSVNIDTITNPENGRIVFNNQIGSAGRYYSTAIIRVKDNTSISYSYSSPPTEMGDSGTASLYTAVSLERLL